MTDSNSGKTVLVTGANRGIGLELTRQLKGRGAVVIAACRSGNPELSELGVDVIENADVGSHEGVAHLAAALDGRQLDWVINNAGIFEHDSLDSLDFDAIERQFRINTLGPLRVTAALRDNLVRGSKVFVITSTMGSISDNTSGGYYGYRISKAGVNMVFKSLSEDLRDHGIGAYMLHPGYVATDMTSGRGSVPAHQAAQSLIQRMEELGHSDTGTFRHARGHDLDW